MVRHDDHRYVYGVRRLFNSRSDHTLTHMIFNWKQQQKYHIDNVEGYINKEIFAMALFSGLVPFVFTFTPSYMKRLWQWLSYHVAEYEKKEGKIQCEDWTPSQVSPWSEEINKNKPHG